MAQPIDFVGARGGWGYRVEVKRLAASEHDALCATVMKTLNAALKSDTQPIVIDMYLDEAFEAADINELVRHVKRALREPCTGKAYEFACEGEVVASYKFRPSANATYPYVGVLGDFAGELRNVTGVEASRVLRKVRRAYDKFKACPDDGAVHLVALAVDNTVHLADVAEALYGREHVTFTRQGHASSGRGPGGAFHRGPDGHSRLDGLVVARRLVSSRLFCAYVFTLFVNPAGTLPVADVAEALGVDRVLGPDEFP